MMSLEQLRDRLLQLRKGSAFKGSPIKIIDVTSGRVFRVENVVFDTHSNGTTYIKVKPEEAEDVEADASSRGSAV